jgi:hypothetical protein
MAGMKDSSKGTALADNGEVIGYVDPLIGRVARKDVVGYFGFPLIRAGQAVTPEIIEKAQALGRLFELISATDDV